MMPVLYTVHSVSALAADFAADFLVASIWQGLVMAAFVALLLRWLPGLTAALRSAIWTVVLLLVMFFPGLSLALRSGRAPATAHAGLLHAGLLHANETWSLALLSVWVVFSLLRISQLVGSAVRLRSMARRAEAVTPSESVAAVLCASKRRVVLCSSAEVDRPSVAGFFRPRILLSPELLANLSVAELEQVVLHEVEHLRRYDDWTNLLQKLSLVLVPLHPVLLWLDRRLCLERELACDDSVLRHTHARKAYAACLARLAEHSIVHRGFSLALGALGSRSLGSRERSSELAGRVHRILRAPEKRMSPARVWLATVALLAAVFAGAAGLASSPQLVSFTSAAQPLGHAQVRFTRFAKVVTPATFATPAPRLEAASFQPPASFQPAAGFPSRVTGSRSFAAHQTLLKAVLLERRPLSAVSAAAVPHVALPAVASKSTPRVRLARTTLGHGLTMRNPYSRYFAVTAWRPITMLGQPMAVVEDSQFLYAAVPIQDGWLIIQL
jgi:beta-lactamase regulating signal transducer with metallopeptidase domain